MVETGHPRFWQVSNFSVCVWFHKENLLVGSQIHWYWAANARFIFVAQFGTGVNCGESYHDIKGKVPVDGQRYFIAFREPWFTWRSTGHECRIIKQEYKKRRNKRQEIAAVACSSSKEAMVFSILTRIISRWSITFLMKEIRVGLSYTIKWNLPTKTLLGISLFKHGIKYNLSWKPIEEKLFLNTEPALNSVTETV